MAVAFPLLVEPDDHPLTSLLDHPLRPFHLLPAVTLDAVEYMPVDALRMHPAEHIFLTGNLTHHQGNGFLLPVVIENLIVFAKPGSKRSFGDPYDHAFSFFSET